MRNPSENISDVLREFWSGAITIREFHQRLEPALNRLPAATREHEAKFREYVNRLELIVYTLPPNDQAEAGKRLADEIGEFLGCGAD